MKKINNSYETNKKSKHLINCDYFVTLYLYINTEYI